MPRRLRVLIVDDHPGLVKAVSRLLAWDYDVVGSVADGSGLLEAVQNLQPDVIVLDVNLPNVDGLKACRQITQLNPKDESHRVHGRGRSGRQATSLPGRSICLCR
jgi:CheY-like chemotaxis protein